jgi:hypothetical protein
VEGNYAYTEYKSTNANPVMVVAFAYTDVKSTFAKNVWVKVFALTKNIKVVMEV